MVGETPDVPGEKHGQHRMLPCQASSGMPVDNAESPCRPSASLWCFIQLWKCPGRPGKHFYAVQDPFYAKWKEVRTMARQDRDPELVLRRGNMRIQVSPEALAKGKAALAAEDAELARCQRTSRFDPEGWVPFPESHKRKRIKAAPRWHPSGASSSEQVRHYVSFQAQNKAKTTEDVLSEFLGGGK